MSDCYMHNSKGVDVNDVHNSRPNTNCTCDGVNGSERGEGQGPATDPKLLEKGSGAYDHPQTPKATGPAKESE